MHRFAAAVGSVLLLSSILLIMLGISLVYIPPVGHVVVTMQTTVTALTTSLSNNATSLNISLEFPNGTKFSQGQMFAGTFGSVLSSYGNYFFQKISQGAYPLNISKVGSVYLPPTNVKILPGANLVKLTVYPLDVFELVETSGLTFNGSQPGPTIHVKNATAVTVVIRNNTTLIHNVAVVESLGNTSSVNILFNSLSATINAGGTTNETFIVTQPGSFYYECLIGSHAHDGEYGYFIVAGQQRPVR